ncbi:mycofactocin-coupled SDR family oxidoreductase [Tomitella fengzijianii]|uniref:3-oxoacyl-[acyl-carrier-protein] reductase MabA n=1 Tax=Tomitella fengzijianii TaxID=2597660 RepID=A0A516X352_9ACTN|nr:mycofactocin-coupled SDR family oxidoreductase [Tomitella fengzijianii]QDQ97506.1 NAD(P)-dependent oxidoreductase [Tomitella fengzijianii]
MTATPDSAHDRDHDAARDPVHDFAGRTVLITGAARGQGRSHAVEFARRGASIVAADLCADVDTIPYPLATVDDLEQTRALVEQEGARCLAVRADVRDPARMHEVVDEVVRAFGGIDICIANAGVVSFGPVVELTDAQWSTMLDIDLTGVFHTLRAVAPGMTARGWGRIITIASMGGRAGTPNLGHYSAAKWGAIGLTKTLALELAGTGVTANIVCPGTVSTDMVHNPAMYSLFAPDMDSPTREQVRGRYARLNPLGEPWTDPADVTAAVAYLASPAARHVTGETLEIGAGVSARMP